MSIMPAILAYGMWSWWSVAQTGEVKGAGTRRHWYTMILAAVIQYALLIVMVLLIFNTIGEQFISAANYLYSVAPEKYAIPVSPSMPLLVGLIPGGIILPWFIVLTFIPWTPLVHFIQFVQPPRALFAWSFDRLLPAKVTEVNERTHAPLIAIVSTGLIGVALWVWANLAGASYFAVLGLASLTGFLTVLFMGITAIIFPYVKRELYRSSPAKIEVARIPVCVIAGLVSAIAALGVSYGYLTDPRLGLADPVGALIFLLALLVGTVVYYYIARAYRSRQGINLDYLFKEIPPE